MSRLAFVSGGKKADACQQPADVARLLVDQRVRLGLGRLLGVHDVVDRLVVERVLVVGGGHPGQPVLQSAPQGAEATGQAPPVDGHDETDRRLSPGLGIVIGGRNVVLDGVVQLALGLGHVDEYVFDDAVGHRRRDHAGLEIPSQQLTGVAGDQSSDRRTGQHDTDGGGPFAGFQVPARGCRRVAERLEDLVRLELALPRHEPQDAVNRRRAEEGFGGLEQAGHVLEIGMGGIGMPDGLEEAAEILWRPCRRKAEQVHQIPHLDRVDLHRRGGHQHQALRALLQAPHQPQEAVGAALAGGAGSFAPGMVRLVEDDEVPRLGVLQQLGHPVGAPHKLAGGDDGRLRVPVLPRHFARRWRLEAVARIPVEGLAIIDRPVEVELLAQFDLPLPEHRLWGEDQDAFRPARQPRLAQQESGLDRLAETDLVGNQQPRRPVVVHAVEGPHLMRPGCHRSGGLADPFSAVRHGRRMADEPPQQTTQVGRRRRWLGNLLRRCFGDLRIFRLLLQLRRQFVVRGQELKEVLAHRRRHVEDDGGLGLVRPQLGEGGLLAVDVVAGTVPIGEDVKTVPVVLPALDGLVDAAREGEAIAGLVLDDPGFLVENGGAGHRAAMAVAGDRHLHLQDAAGHHPGQQLQRRGSIGVEFIEGCPQHHGFDRRGQRCPLGDGLDLGLVQGAADDQTHPAVVAAQSLDTSGGQRQRGRREIPGGAVVADRRLQGRHIEQRKDITVLGRVLGVPGAVGKETHLRITRLVVQTD